MTSMIRLLLILIICSLNRRINVHSMANLIAELKYPCAFIDTINITGNFVQRPDGNYTIYRGGASNGDDDHIKLNNLSHGNDTENGHGHGQGYGQGQGYGNGTRIGIENEMGYGNFSYNHINWIEIPRDSVAVYNFVVRNGLRIPVANHLRACVCKLRPCIRFCCADGHFYDVINHTCSSKHEKAREKEKEEEAIIETAMNQNEMIVRGQNGSKYRIATSEHFIIDIGTPCERMRTVYNDNKELIQWTLLENGSIVYKQHHFTKHYCYSPYRLENRTWLWQPLVCPLEKLPFVLGVREWTYVICLILATICMAIIFFMHLFCKEMRNSYYGVAIEAYTLCLIIGYSLTMHLVVKDPTKMPTSSCSIIPCFMLLFLLLSFYILILISFHFYLSYHGIVLTKMMFWLIFVPVTSFVIGWSIFVGFERYGGKTVFGGETCWFDPRNWTIMIYFNAPILVACSVCVFFYILTLIAIREQQENGTKNLATEAEEKRYRAFWQFFGYTFITWLVNVISFVINYYRDHRTHINYAVCLIVILHGFGSLYTLIGRNQQIQNFLRRIEDGIDDDDDEEEACESALPMTPLQRDSSIMEH